MKFEELDLPKELTIAIEKHGYKNPTPIQEEIIPEILEGNDVIGCSQTGSGKTGAFLIPILGKLISNQKRKAIIVAPTRELAIQIMDNAKLFLTKIKNIPVALLIGGASIKEQLMSIQRTPRLIVGTPGRINDFLDSKRLNIEDFDILVLDEMDRMLDMGFMCQIDNIVKKLAKNRQTMLFSATVSKKIESATQKYLKDPIIIKIGETNSPSANITQEIIDVENDKKFDLLVEKLKGNTLFTLVFVKTKYSTERIADKLKKSDIMARAIHGDLKQNKRAKIIKDFRDKKFNVLVATDVAARGLDIDHIDTVINYDLPQAPEDYIHRIGRCSRGMEKKGCSISFCNKSDRVILKAIESLIKNGDYSENARVGNKKANKKPRRNKNMENKKIETRKDKPRRDRLSEKVKNKNTSGYNFDELQPSKNKRGQIKRPTAYSTSNSRTTAFERRKKLGLTD